jgi:hypothetical protein
VTQRWSRRGGEEKNSHPSSGIESRSFDRPSRSQSLYRYSEILPPHFECGCVGYWRALYLMAPATVILIESAIYVG